ncbi:MAG: alpha/beta fold hydrolase [Actinobacteria bacterium]|nr:alpha/beta fold hydrolase [Actinomycetota bacterium]
MAGGDARERLLAAAPVEDRRLRLAGVSTAVLVGGDGPPVVLLHGQGGFAAMWLAVIADLVTTHHVVAPDLPGLGASEAPGGPPDAAGVLAWLGELIERTCPEPPVVVGHSLGGSIAARFAADHGDRLAGLVLVAAGGLAGRVRPAPGVVRALIRHGVRPSERTFLRLFAQLTLSPERTRRRMGEGWGPFAEYMVDRSGAPGVRRANRRLLRRLGLPGIPPEDLARIKVPTTLIWGRHDRVMRLRAAEEASRRHGWPLHVIEDAAHLPHAEQPDAAVRALRAALGAP